MMGPMYPLRCIRMRRLHGGPWPQDVPYRRTQCAARPQQAVKVGCCIAVVANWAIGVCKRVSEVRSHWQFTEGVKTIRTPNPRKRILLGTGKTREEGDSTRCSESTCAAPEVFLSLQQKGAMIHL